MMIMRTILLTLACISKLTRFLFIIQRMIFTLFPAMRFRANCIVWTTIHIINNKIRAFPIGTLYRLIRKYVRFSPVVLPVVSVDTGSFVVGGKVEGAPLGFKMEYVKIIIPIKIMNQFYRNILLTMSKGTESSILTLVHVVGIKRTEFSFVFIGFVQLLDTVMSFLAVITVWTYLFSFFCVFTQFDSPEISWSFLILFIMVIRAVLMIMLILYCALLTLEIHKL